MNKACVWIRLFQIGIGSTILFKTTQVQVTEIGCKLNTRFIKYPHKFPLMKPSETSLTLPVIQDSTSKVFMTQ